MAKLDYTARTLDDEIIKDGLCAVSTLSQKEKKEGKKYYMVVGGVAVQGYIPSLCRRSTADIDLCLGIALNFTEFKNDFSKTVSEHLQDHKYEVIPHKNRFSYSLEIISKEGERAQIEFSRRTSNRLNNHKDLEKRLKRELDNRRTKTVEDRNDTYEVCSPEDIGVPKLVRCINSLERNPYFITYVNKLRDSKNFDKEKVKETLDYINYLREQATYNKGDIRAAEELRFASDVYDMRILTEQVGFNKKYLELAVRDWDTIRKKHKIRDQILRGIFPKMEFLNKKTAFRKLFH